MIYRRRTYKVDPARAEAFNRFFAEHLLPLQRKYGAELVGRWISEDRREIMALWRYHDKEQYSAIEARIGADPASAHAREVRKSLDPLYLETRQEWFVPTGDYD